MPRPSFLCLQFDVDPGGARKDAHWIRATLAEIRADLEAELRDGHSLYYLCWYGARLRLHVFQGVAYERSVDLLPLLRVDIDGYPTITFNADGTMTGVGPKESDGPPVMETKKGKWTKTDKGYKVEAEGDEKALHLVMKDGYLEATPDGQDEAFRLVRA